MTSNSSAIPSERMQYAACLALGAEISVAQTGKRRPRPFTASFGSNIETAFDDHTRIAVILGLRPVDAAASDSDSVDQLYVTLCTWLGAVVDQVTVRFSKSFTGCFSVTMLFPSQQDAQEAVARLRGLPGVASSLHNPSALPLNRLVFMCRGGQLNNGHSLWSLTNSFRKSSQLPPLVVDVLRAGEVSGGDAALSCLHFAATELATDEAARGQSRDLIWHESPDETAVGDEGVAAHPRGPPSPLVQRFDSAIPRVATQHAGQGANQAGQSGHGKKPQQRTGRHGRAELSAAPVLAVELQRLIRDSRGTPTQRLDTDSTAREQRQGRLVVRQNDCVAQGIDSLQPPRRSRLDKGGGSSVAYPCTGGILTHEFIYGIPPPVSTPRHGDTAPAVAAIPSSSSSHRQAGPAVVSLAAVTASPSTLKLKT